MDCGNLILVCFGTCGEGLGCSFVVVLGGIVGEGLDGIVGEGRGGSFGEVSGLVGEVLGNVDEANDV